MLAMPNKKVTTLQNHLNQLLLEERAVVLNGIQVWAVAGPFVLRPEVGKLGSAPLLSLLGTRSRRRPVGKRPLICPGGGLILIWGPVSFFRRIADIAVSFSPDKEVCHDGLVSGDDRQ